MVAVTIESFKERSDSSEPFHVREGVEVPTIRDDYLKDEPVFVLNLGQDFRLRLSMKCLRTANLPIKGIASVTAVPMDGMGSKLMTEEGTSNDHEWNIVASLRPDRMGSQRMLMTSPAFGEPEKRYLPLDLLIGLHSEEHQLKHRIYLKMIPANRKPRLLKAFRLFERKWRNAPQWIRVGARASILIADLVTRAV